MQFIERSNILFKNGTFNTSVDPLYLTEIRTKIIFDLFNEIREIHAHFKNTVCEKKIMEKILKMSSDIVKSIMQ